MAIQCDITTKHGLLLSAAYIRISYIHGDKNKMAVEYAIYPNQTLRDLNKDAVEVGIVEIDQDLGFNGNSFQFAYSELKKNNRFREAIDI